MNRQIIEAAIYHKPSISNLISNNLSGLFNSVQQIQTAVGVVYAVRVPTSLDGLEMGTGVIHSTIPIPTTNIIGKVKIPLNIDINKYNQTLVSHKHKEKLFNIPNGLGILLRKKNNPMEDELLNRI